MVEQEVVGQGRELLDLAVQRVVLEGAARLEAHGARHTWRRRRIQKAQQEKPRLVERA